MFIRFARVLAATIIIGSIVLACATSPLGRKQLSLFPDAEIDAMGVSAFQQLKEKTPLSNDARAVNYVNCVAHSVTRAIGRAQGSGQWEVRVFEHKAANAFALPGSKIGVFSGILNVARNQDQLAAVIGHEIAHVLARHANERASTEFATKTGLDLVQIVSGTPTTTKSTLLAALGLGAQVGILLPYDRAQEREADLIGLDLMARAGFDPRQSLQLWQNMAKAGNGQPPEFLSTHPAHQTRMGELNARMSHAMGLYERARAQGMRPYCAY
jgi:predicted Zn-dependent protease